MNSRKVNIFLKNTSKLDNFHFSRVDDILSVNCWYLKRDLTPSEMEVAVFLLKIDGEKVATRNDKMIMNFSKLSKKYSSFYSRER